MSEEPTTWQRWKKVLLDSLKQFLVLAPVILTLDWLGLLP